MATTVEVALRPEDLRALIVAAKPVLTAIEHALGLDLPAAPVLRLVTIEEMGDDDA